MERKSPRKSRKSVTKMAKFSVGEKVKAKWPGSTLYFDAEVKAFHDGNTHTYTVVFDENYEEIVPESSLMANRCFRSKSSSPARKRRSRSRSPGRGRKRSPSPSPARETKPKTPPRSRRKSRKNSPPSSPEPTPRRSSRSRKVPQIVEVKDEEIAVTRTEEKRQVVVEEKSETVQFVRMTRSQAKKLAAAEEAPKKEITSKSEYEFGGPIGVFQVVHIFPFLLVCSYLFCNKDQCALKQIPKLPPWNEFFDLTAFMVVLGWIHLLALLYMIPIGKVVSGFPSQDGTCLQYRMNGFLSLSLVLSAFGAGLHYKKIPVEYVYDKFLALMTSSVILSFLLSIGVYIKARVEKTGLSPTGNTDSGFYNFVMGHQLNPRKFGVDFKILCIRVGLIGWVLVNFCMALKAYKETQTLPVPLILVCSFQFICTADAMWFEDTFLSSPDFNRQGFGFLISFGGVAWIPFVYSLQSRFLVDHHPVHLTQWAVFGIVMLQALGYVIYRGANSQKYLFRKDPGHPEFADAVTIETPSGKRLLASGCWGMVRHPNYLGDILMSISWSLPCGFTHAIPYFYPLYVIILLVDRAHRDELSCAQRYGESWNEYCRRVPYKIIPKIF